MSWRDLFSWRAKDADLHDEIQSHLELAIQDRIARGESPEQARRAARRELGNVPLVAEDTRAVWAWPWLEGVWRDTIHAVRLMRRESAFTAVAIATLTIGIGAHTAIFSLVNAVVLRPLQTADADRIVRFIRTIPTGTSSQASLPLASVWLQQRDVFEDVSAHRLDLINLTGRSAPEQIPTARVTKDFFHLFGAPLAVGRTFSADEDRPGGGHVAVLGYGLWVRQFGASAEVIGRTVSLGSEPYIIIGVLGPGFDSGQFDQVPDVWLPLQLDPNTRDVGGEWCFVSARLKPETTIETASARLAASLAEYRKVNPQADPRLSFSVQPIRDAIVGNMASSLRVLEAAVGLLLLIACANVANLLLIRGTGRAREMAVRAAIGADRGRLIRQLVTESLLLAVGGSVCGLVLGFGGIRALLAAYPGQNPTILGNNGVAIPRIGEHASAVTIDWRVVMFTIGASLVVSVMAGLLPALHASRVDLQLGLKRTGGGTGGGRRQTQVRGILVGAEVALALMLLVGASLLIRTSLALRAISPGFVTERVLTMRMSLSGTPFETRAGIERLTRDGISRILAIPGVESASTTCCMPLETVWQLPFVVQGRPLTGRFHAFAGWTFVSPGYFDVFKIPILRGRDFTERDDASAPGVVIINQEMARRIWPTTDPFNDRLLIGRAIRPDYEKDPVRQVIAIVGDVHDESLRVKPRPAMYVPVAQVPDGVTALNVRLLPIVWVARTKSEPHSLASAVEKGLQDVSGGLPVTRVRSMDQVVSESTARARFDMLLMTVFAGSALLLAAVGVYGLMAYSVAQRTQEMGIRLALGARPDQVWRMVIAHGMRPALAGIAAGTVASWMLARILANLLFGVSPRDPAIFVAVPLVFAAISLLAVWLPAVRAARIAPMNALRYE